MNYGADPEYALMYIRGVRGGWTNKPCAEGGLCTCQKDGNRCTKCANTVEDVYLPSGG